MQICSLSRLVLLASAIPASVFADGAFYGDPPDQSHPWTIHDMNRAQPPRVEPGTFSSQQQPGKPPSDAIVLFDGSEGAIANWQADKTPAVDTNWVVKEGSLQCVPGSGYVRSKEEFGDCQLHIEWSAPSEVKGDSQGRGNSGVFLMGQVEVQVLDNYNNPTYADGFAGSVYGINPPMANPLQAPGEWQVYDIVFRRPLFKDGQQIDPGYLTVFVNGVLVQDHTPIDGGGGHRARSKTRPFPDQGPLKLQDHGNPVRYRNIWYRPLPKRALDGGDTSVMSPEATQARREVIAQSIREDAATKEGVEQMLRLMESLCYAPNEAAWGQVSQQAEAFGKGIAETSADKIESQKGLIMRINSALQYMIKFKLLPSELPLAGQLDAIVKEREWDKKK